MEQGSAADSRIVRQTWSRAGSVLHDRSVVALPGLHREMIRFRPPTEDVVDAFLARQRKAEFTYADVGATDRNPPERYVLDRTRRRLGSGAETYEAAVGALKAWRQFDLEWVRVAAPSALRAGGDVAIVAYVFGVWWLNACRIVYVQEENDVDARRFSFAYGTLPDHAGEGEERFSVEIDETGEVTFEISAFSRPRHVLSRLAYPLMRAHQKQFGREAADAMERAVANWAATVHAEPAPAVA